ncbi:MAG: EAL domain-containing protein [Bacillota bacterium]|nr:EAL domain-containing protein [Bacillota bacterium]
MIRKNYNNMILIRVEKSFDKIIPFAVIGSWLSAITIYFSEIPKDFVCLDILLGLGFLYMGIRRKQLIMEIKIMMTVLMLIFIGIFSFLDGGFSSAAITLFIISNSVAILLLSKKRSIIISFIVIGVFLSLWFISFNELFGTTNSISISKWIVQFISFFLYIFIMHILNFAIRNYLLENIIELEDSMELTYKLAYYDSLTGLANLEMLKKYLNKRINSSLENGYIVCVSLKNLNLINSIYGNAIGDEVLKEVANLLLQIKEHSEFVARVSGNDFVVWVENVSQGILINRLKLLKRKFYKQFRVVNMTKKVEFYISYSECKKEDIIEESYDKAMLALTYAKLHDNTKFVAYDQALEDIVRYEETLKEELKIAILSNEFELYYQNKVNAKTGLIKGVEALARWKSKSFGVIGPSEFIPIIEKNNMSIIFGELIIRKAFTEYEALCKKFNNKELIMSLNISPIHLNSDKFTIFTDIITKEFEINPKFIILEITEAVLLESNNIIVDRIRDLRALGFRISLDDFGTGYSSLNYLNKFDIDEIKIDKSFVDQIEDYKTSDALLKTIINLSKEYELDLVAEGVETEEQCDYLVKLGCYIIQGYYFSKPEPV